MALSSLTLTEALGLRGPRHLFATTYSLDEWELFSMLFDLGALHGKATIRFDPAAYRGTKGRVVAPRFLMPIAPVAGSAGRMPPIYHPKLALASDGGVWRLVVSTANLASSDQRDIANVLLKVDLKDTQAQAVRSWIVAAKPRRTLCVVRSGTTLRVEVGNEPTWALFQRQCPASELDGADWIIAAPFWSTAAFRLIRARTAHSVNAYFREAAHARLVGGPFSSARLSCYAPASKATFHQKVIAVRTRGSARRVVLYIGSANMTTAGFFGVKRGSTRTAWNWEAGLIQVGGDELWDVARHAARAGVPSWRKLRVDPVADDGKERETEEEDLEGRLRVHLRSCIHLRGNRIERKDTPSFPGSRLRSVTVQLDETKRVLRANRFVSVQGEFDDIEVMGVYDEGDRKLAVSIPVPSLTRAPRTDDISSTIASLRRLLLDPSSLTEGGDGKREDDAPDANVVADDVRFPFREFFARLADSPDGARAWLRHCERTARGDGIGFWQWVAAELGNIVK